MEESTVSSEYGNRKLDDATNALYESVQETYDPDHPHRELLHDVIQQAIHQVWRRIGTHPPDDSQARGITVSQIWNIADDLKEEDRETEFKERCEDVHLKTLEAQRTIGVVNGDAGLAPEQEEEKGPVFLRRKKDFSLFQEDMNTFEPRERNLLGMPCGLYYDAPNPLNILLAFEWNQDLVLGPGSVTLSAPSLTALQMWDNVCQGKANFSNQEAYLVCEAACYQKDELWEQISRPLKNKAFSELLTPIPSETPNLIQQLRGLPLDKRPYLPLHHGDIPVSWPNATGRKIYLKIESGESDAPVTLPVDQHLHSRFASRNSIAMSLPSSFLNGGNVTRFTFLFETEEEFSPPEDKPRVFAIQTRAPSASEIADAIGGGLPREIFAPYKHIIGDIPRP